MTDRNERAPAHASPAQETAPAAPTVKTTQKNRGNVQSGAE